MLLLLLLLQLVLFEQWQPVALRLLDRQLALPHMTDMHKMVWLGTLGTQIKVTLIWMAEVGLNACAMFIQMLPSATMHSITTAGPVSAILLAFVGSFHL